jgi:hypothetical protein
VSGVYGKLIEHPELPIDDPGRFTIEILPHRYEWDGNPYSRAAACIWCGFAENEPFHHFQGGR